jgi:hypothetical protein
MPRDGNVILKAGFHRPISFLDKNQKPDYRKLSRYLKGMKNDYRPPSWSKNTTMAISISVSQLVPMSYVFAVIREAHELGIEIIFMNNYGRYY